MADNEEVEVMPEVELSSDSEEEEDDREISLIVMKRPPKVKRIVQDIEVRIRYFSSSINNKCT